MGSIGGFQAGTKRKLASGRAKATWISAQDHKRLSRPGDTATNGDFSRSLQELECIGEFSLSTVRSFDFAIFSNRPATACGRTPDTGGRKPKNRRDAGE
jgi:hypothetical protein